MFGPSSGLLVFTPLPSEPSTILSPQLHFALECCYSFSNIAIQAIDGGFVVHTILPRLESKNLELPLIRSMVVRKILGSLRLFVGSTVSLAGRECGIAEAKGLPMIGSNRQHKSRTGRLTRAKSMHAFAWLYPYPLLPEIRVYRSPVQWN